MPLDLRFDSGYTIHVEWQKNIAVLCSCAACQVSLDMPLQNY